MVLPWHSFDSHSLTIDVHLFFLQFESISSAIHKSMALFINKALLDLSKLEPLDGTNYKRWSQMLLIFFERLEVECVLFSNLPKENNAIEMFVASPDAAIRDKSKTTDQATLKKIWERQQNGQGASIASCG